MPRKLRAPKTNVYLLIAFIGIIAVLVIFKDSYMALELGSARMIVDSR